MNVSPLVEARMGDLLLVQIAREIAIDHHDIETILKRYQIDPDRWEEIQGNPRFVQILESEVAAWQGAMNTPERIKLKSQAMIEEWLPEAFARLHNAGDPLSAKVELAKLIRVLASVGEKAGGGGESVGERFSVTINLGGDAKLTFEKQLPPKVIELEPVNGGEQNTPV